MTAICVGRFFFGVAIGVFSVVVPKMIEETTPSYLLQTFGISTNLALTFGEMIVIIMGSFLP